MNDERHGPVLILDQFGMIAGAQRVALDLARCLLREGHRVVIASPAGRLHEAASGLGCEVHETSVPRFDVWLRSRELAQLAPTAVITNGPRTWLLGVLLKRRLGIPWAVYLHSAPHRRWQRALLRKLGSESDVQVVVAGDLLRIMPSAKVVHNAASPGYLLSADLPVMTGHIKFLGRDDPIKGFIDFQRLATSTPVAATKGFTFEAALGSALSGAPQARRQVGPEVALVGARSAEWFTPGDIVVVPSRFEACPLVILEAQARGAIVISYAVGGIPEIVEDGVTGFLVSRDDGVSGLARVIDALAVAPLDEIAAVSVNARQMASTRTQGWCHQILGAFGCRRAA